MEVEILAKSMKPHNICDVLRDLLQSVQFKKREKHPWRSVNCSKVAGLKPATLLQSIKLLPPNYHRIKYARERVFTSAYFPCRDDIKDSVLLRENTGQRKPVFLHILYMQGHFGQTII